MSETALGTIVRLQVQREPLKTKGVEYDPAPILAVERASVDPLGMVGWTESGWVLDAHHSAHPRARGGGNRALSIGFTGHYDRMAERFGSAPVGVAGENIIVENGGRLFEKDLRGTLVIRGANGDVEMTGARVAAPCREFTSFLLGLDQVPDRAVLAEDLEFLEQGTRGFILDVSGLEGPALIDVGAEVVLRS
jgi:MOSC domain-containing protein YiiM